MLYLYSSFLFERPINNDLEMGSWNIKKSSIVFRTDGQLDNVHTDVDEAVHKIILDQC